MSKPKTKRWLSSFDEIKDLGAGGNADVYLVTEKTSGCQYALKELRNRNEEKKSRFISEIQIAKENSAIIPGIIPVIIICLIEIIHPWIKQINHNNENINARKDIGNFNTIATYFSTFFNKNRTNKPNIGICHCYVHSKYHKISNSSY